jgi:hypothetical protein
MSDLIEKVARAIRDKTDHGSEEQSRAAIAAVAEWIGERHQIDKDGSTALALTWQYTASCVDAPRPEVK